MRKLSSFASRIANAVVGPQGSGMPASEVTIGPKRVRVERARARLERAVGLPRLHGDRAARHLLGLAVVEVGRRRARHERELIRREAVGRRDRVAPRHRARVADQHERHAVERRALDVDLAGDREVRLVEALGAVPREVRVAEQQAAPLRVPSRPTATAFEPAASSGSSRLSPAAMSPGSRSGIGADGPGGWAPAMPSIATRLAREQDELVEAQEGVLRGDRPDPLLAAAVRGRGSRRPRRRRAGSGCSPPRIRAPPG